MEYPSFAKQANTDTGAFTLTQFSAQANEQRFNIAPLDTAAGWSGKYLFQRLLLLTLHFW